MKNDKDYSDIETCRDGFFVDTLLDSDPETPKVKAETFIDGVLEAVAPDGEVSDDEAIDIYTFISNRKELDDFSTEEKEQMLGNCIDAL